MSNSVPSYDTIVTEEVVARLLHNHSNSNLTLDTKVAALIAKHLVTELVKLRDVRTGLREIEQKRKELDQMREDLKAQVRKIQSTCPHLATTFYGDAAGGSDSHTSCNLCGADV